MAIITVLWEKWVEFKGGWVQITLSALIAPLLYILAFGFGLGGQLEMEGRPYLDFLLPGVIALTTMNVSFSAVGMALNVQKLYERSFDNVMISPTPMCQYVLGQMLGGSLRGFYAGVLVLILGACFGAQLQLSLGFFLIMLLNGMVFASLGIMAAVLSKTHAGISRFSSFVLTPMSFLGNTFFSMANLPVGINWGIQALPLTQTAALLRSLSWGVGWDWWRVGILVLYNLIFLLIALCQINRMKNI